MCGYVTGESEAEVERLAEVMRERMPPQLRPQPGARVAGMSFVGTPPQIVEQIQALEEAGVGRIMLQHREMPARADLELVRPGDPAEGLALGLAYDAT